MDDYNAILRLFPEDVEAYYRRGLLYLENNDGSEPKQILTRQKGLIRQPYSRFESIVAVQIDDNWRRQRLFTHDCWRPKRIPIPFFYMNRAECLLNTDQVSKAAADFAIRVDFAKQPVFLHPSGRVRLEQFDKTAARKISRKQKDGLQTRISPTSGSREHSESVTMKT